MSGYAKRLGYLLRDLGNESWPIIRLEREWEIKARDDFSYEKLKCYSVSEAVSDIVGKASIHPEKVSLRVSVSVNFRVGGMCVKSIGQASPGICPQD